MKYFNKAVNETLKIMNNQLVSDSTGFTAYKIINGIDYQDELDRKISQHIKKKESFIPQVKDNIIKSREIQKKYYDRKVKNRKLEIGMWMMVKNFKKTKIVREPFSGNE